MTLLRRVHAGEHGQMAVTFGAVMIVLGVAGFLVIDIGFWYGDRRAVQADADFAAIAGAMELPDFQDDAGAAEAARTAATSWALANDVDPASLAVEVVSDCFSVDDEVNSGVRVTVRTKPESPFISFFSSLDPEVSASAVACSGSPTSEIGFMPWALETTGDCFQDDPVTPTERIPFYGQRCDIVVGGSDSESGSIGQLGFANPGDCSDGDPAASTYEDNVLNGVNRYCEVGDGVTSSPGVNVGKTRTGLAARLAGEGACSTAAQPVSAYVQTNTTNFNNAPGLVDLQSPAGGIDDFFEIWGPGPGYDVGAPGERLSPYDCDPDTVDRETSPRNVVIIMVRDIGLNDGVGCSGGASGSKCYEIQGFARMFLEGCSTAAQGFRAQCDQGGGGSSFTIHARFVGSAGASTRELGLSRYGDVVTFLKE